MQKCHKAMDIFRSLHPPGRKMAIALQHFGINHLPYRPIDSFPHQSDLDPPLFPLFEVHLLLRLLLALEELQLDKSLPSVMDLDEAEANVSHLKKTIFPWFPLFHLEQHLPNFTLVWHFVLKMFSLFVVRKMK